MTFSLCTRYLVLGRCPMPYILGAPLVLFFTLLYLVPKTQKITRKIIEPVSWMSVDCMESKWTYRIVQQRVPSGFQHWLLYDQQFLSNNQALYDLTPFINLFFAVVKPTKNPLESVLTTICCRLKCGSQLAAPDFL